MISTIEVQSITYTRVESFPPLCFYAQQTLNTPTLNITSLAIHIKHMYNVHPTFRYLTLKFS